MPTATACSKSIFFFFIWVLAFSFDCFAELPAPRFEAYRVLGNQKKKVEAFSGAAKWSWQNVGVGAQALKARAVFTIPEALSNATIEVANPSASIKTKDKKLQITTSDLVTKVNFNRSATDIIQIEFHMIVPKGGVFDEGCEALGIQLQFSESELPFYLGARCQKTANAFQLQISFPSEADVDKSSIFDSQGKGESWRVYELGNLDAAQGELAKITLKFKDKNYDLGVSSNKKSEVKKGAAEAKFAVGVGYDSLKFKSPVTSAADSKPVFFLKGLPYKLFWRIGLGIDLATAVGLSQNENSISYLQIVPYGYLRLIESKSMILEGRGYFSISSQTHSASGGGYQYNRAGVGFLSGFRLSPNWKMMIEARTDSLGSTKFKSHFFADLHILRTNRLSWGFGVQSQNLTVNETTTEQHQFSHTLFYGLVVY
tara:strand:+ start:6485 stop:7768 length:1284 start_codon:yes stop_codon:yes gene_type:complete